MNPLLDINLLKSVPSWCHYRLMHIHCTRGDAKSKPPDVCACLDDKVVRTFDASIKIVSSKKKDSISKNNIEKKRKKKKAWQSFKTGSKHNITNKARKPQLSTKEQRHRGQFQNGLERHDRHNSVTEKVKVEKNTKILPEKKKIQSRRGLRNPHRTRSLATNTHTYFFKVIFSTNINIIITQTGYQKEQKLLQFPKYI